MTDPNGQTPSAGPHLSLDAILDLLSHRHRRAMLETLRSAPDRTVSKDELISRLRDCDQDRTGVRPSRTYVAQRLHHVHVPKLDQAGVVTYIPEREQYRYHPDEKLEQWLDLIEAEHDSEL